MSPSNHTTSLHTPSAPTLRRVVITGVNLVEGGTLTAFREMVRAAVQHTPRWEVIALVHRAGILGIEGVREIEFPDIKRSWLKRMWFEWSALRGLSKALGATVWISMHDITPRVDVARQFVYCHNPSPFATVSWRQSLKDRTFTSFRLMYGWLYGVNIRRNTAVVVQQDWLREEFKRRYGPIPVIVAHPSGIPADHLPRPAVTRPTTFFYPTLPRVFKNIELIGDALGLLEAKPGWSGRVSVTIDGSENAYARTLVERYGRLRSLKFIGRQAHTAMNQRYAEHDALLFPSRLETWGLPLTEARDRGMPIVAADMPYAHETIGACNSVSFFDPTDPQGLADLLLGLHQGTVAFGRHPAQVPEAPFAAGWAALCHLMLSDAQTLPSPSPHPGPTTPQQPGSLPC